MLTIHQLEVFATVAQEGSLRRAADRLVVSQPAVSASLAALQREVGTELVVRAGRGIELTEAGRTMERYARQLLSLLGEALDAVRFAHDPVTAPVRLGATTASADHMLMPLLARVRAHRSAAQFTVEVGNRATVWQLLADRAVDVAVSSRPPASGAFESLAMRPNELVVVARPGLVWPGRLGDVTWLVREEGSSTRAATDEVLALLGVDPATLVIGSNTAILRCAEEGLGVAVLPRETVDAALRSRSLATVRVDGTPLQRPWHLLARAGEQLSAATRQLVADMVRLGEGFEWTPAGRAAVEGA